MRGESSKALKASVIAILIIISLVVTAAGAENGEWTEFRNNEQRTGVWNLTSNIVYPKVKWSFETEGPVKSPPTVSDINGDGENEVIFGSNDGHLYVLDRFGSELWNFETEGPVINQPTIGDVDGDDLPEIVFGGYYHHTGDPFLYVLNAEDGSLLWTYESGSPGDEHRGFQASPLLHDVTGDGAQDVLIGSQDHHFYCFNGPTGNIIWKSAIFNHFVRASSPMGDIDLDGELEIIVIDNHAEVRTYEAKTGNLEWITDLGHAVEATPVIADLDADPEDEIVFFVVGSINITGDAIVLNHDGSELWRSSAHTYFYTSPAIINVDSNPTLDIIGGDTDDHTIIAYKGDDGTILWETILPDSTWSQGDLVTSDIDSDGVIEVICGAHPNLYCLNTESGEIEWTFATNDHIWGQPTVADLEQDGLAEILFGCYDNFLYVLENALEPPVADCHSNQTILEGETAYFTGSGYDPNYNWHQLFVNYASDAALFLRTLDPIGPGGGGWEGGVTEWVTFSSNLPFWIAKFEGHLGQGHTGKEYTYYFRMHENGPFTLHFRAGNGRYLADVYDETDSTTVIQDFSVDHGSAYHVANMQKDHVYRIYIHDTQVTNPDFPNDLDVQFEILETDVLLTPDLDSLVYYVSQSPLDLAISGPGVTDITFFSRGEQEFYTYYAYQLDHSEDEVSGGEIGHPWPPYTPTTGITPSQYNDSLLPIGDEVTLSWDFNDYEDLDMDGDYTNDDESSEQNPSKTHGDNGIFQVTLRVTSQGTNMTSTDRCFVEVLNVDPDMLIESPKMEVEIELRMAGSKWSNAALTLYEDNTSIGYLEVERWPGSPEANPTYTNPSLPTTLNLSRSYNAVITYDPYPDSGDEIRGDQPNNGKDPQDNAGNPVWVIIRFQDNSSEKLHHTFNTQQSKKRDSEHPNHIEPWEVDISDLLIGHPFQIKGQISDPGSDDIILNINYGTQSLSFEYLNDPPKVDPFPSPEVNPVDLLISESLIYEGPKPLELMAEDDDTGTFSIVFDL
jgi:outer membrane protein assembly factor BamB/PKD repeat protein